MYLFSVSHEFKTPLSNIQQFATLLQDGTLSEEDREESLKGIVAGTRRLSNMISSMLEFAIAHNADDPMNREVYSLDEQLRQTLILFIPFMEQKRISFEVDLDEVAIRANEHLLDEAWVNIVSNAVKYTDEGGSIRVGLRAKEDHAEVAIADTGIGMSQEELVRAFDWFYRNETVSQEGSGLGLPIAQSIVSRHGGAIHLDSTLGVGTTCTVTLPLH